MKKGIFTIIMVILGMQFANLRAQTGNYDAEYLKVSKEYTLHDDGSYDFHFHKEIKLLTYYAFQRLYGETFIVYNPQYQELKINEAYTVMSDGKKVDAPANAFNEVLPGFARDIPAYNHLREMVVTHTALEIGAIVTLDYTIKTKAGFLPFFYGSEDIGEVVPIKDLSIVINVPQSVELQYRMLNNRTAPAITEDNGRKTFTWSLKDVKALSHSGNQDADHKEALLFSTAKDMTAAFYAFVSEDAFKAAPGPDISRHVDAAIKDKKTDLDKILALQSVVIDEIKLADIPLIYSGYKVRTPEEIWKSANATSLEKAILLAGMLKLANINACPVATISNGLYFADMGSPAVFDGFLVQVNPRELGRIYLSVTQHQNQNLFYDLQDKTMIQLDGTITVMRTFKEKPVTNVMKMDAKLRLAGQGEEEKRGQGEEEKRGLGEEVSVGGEVEVEMSGICNPYYKLRNDSSFVKNMIVGDLPTSSLSSIKEKKLSELTSDYILTWNPEPGTRNFNGFLYLELPRFRTGFDAWNLVQFTGSGDTPVRLDFPLKEVYSYSISLPDNYTLFTPSDDISIQNDLGELNISIVQSGSTIKVKRYFELYKDVITSDKMEDFRKMILAWENVDYRKIEIKQNPR
jgi:hypothetical protein